MRVKCIFCRKKFWPSKINRHIAEAHGKGEIR